MNLTINGKQIPVQGIRALRPGITIEQAVQKTKNNGLDEVFFQSGGRSYIAYGDSLSLSGLKSNKIPTITFNSAKADIVAYDDEANSLFEGMAKGAMDEIKTGMTAVRTAVSNLITTVTPAVAAVGGVGVAGVGIYQIWRASQQAGTVGASLAAAGGVAGGAGSWIGEALKGSVVGGLKVAAISGAVGLGILGGYGAVKGALEARSTVKDLSTIASVTEEGSSPANGGAALAWSQLYPANPTAAQQTNPEQVNIQPVPGYGNSAYGVPSYGSPIFFQQPQQPRPQMNAVGGMMSPQQLRSFSGR